MTDPRRYAQLGRIFSGMLTAGIAVVGAYSTGVAPTWIEFAAFLFIGVMAHAFGGALNEIYDYELDSLVPELQDKPLVSGDISLKKAWLFSIGLLVAGLVVSVLVFPAPLAVVMFLVSHVGAWYYAYAGKYTPMAFELSLGLLFFLWAIYGAICVASTVTPMTFVVAGFIFFFAVFINWGNAVKDVHTDRKLKVPTRAVAWGYEHSQKLTLRDPNAAYGVVIKACLLSFFGIPLLFEVLGWPGFTFRYYVLGVPFYFIFFIIFGLPTQLWIIKKIMGVHDREYWKKFIVADIFITWLIYPFLVVDQAGILMAAFLFIMPFLWFAGTTRLMYGGTMKLGL